MKILYLIDHFETNYPRDQNYIIKYMVEKGHEVTVITSENARFRKYDGVFFPRVSFIRGLSVGRLKGAKLYLHPLIFKSLFKRFDVVHAFTFFTTSSLLGVISYASTRVLRSEIGPPNGLTFAKSKKKLSIHSFLIKIYRELYNYITAYNHIEMESLLMLGFDKRKIAIISPMIDYYKFSKLAKTGIQSGDEIVLGSIARISPEKGIHRLVPLIKGLLRRMQNSKKRFRMVIVGRVDQPSYGFKVLSELQRLLGEHLIYLGEVAPPYMFYRMVDTVIVPSIVETGAINVLEAMAAGKIVIASDIYPINIYIRHGIDGFLFAKISEAVDIIESILLENKSIEYLKSNAQNRAKCYDYRLICSKLEYVYKQSES